MNAFTRGIILTIGLILLWESLVTLLQIPSYILPSPVQVFKSWYTHRSLLISEAITTITETFLGLMLGTLFGCITALSMAFFRPATLWLLPILLISQAIPTFAIAPLLVIWLGYGMSSKIATTILMLFFPITSAFFDGLRRTELGWLDLAKTMQANKWSVFWHIRIPAALPSLASGLRVATAIAPIGAIVGEWVGASKGLGYLMLNSNERMQIDLMFAALLTLIVFSLTLYFSMDKILRKLIPWQQEV